VFDSWQELLGGFCEHGNFPYSSVRGYPLYSRERKSRASDRSSNNYGTWIEFRSFL